MIYDIYYDILKNKWNVYENIINDNNQVLLL